MKPTIWIVVAQSIKDGQMTFHCFGLYGTTTRARKRVEEVKSKMGVECSLVGFWLNEDRNYFYSIPVSEIL